MNGAPGVVFVKELRDALRDRRTLMAVVLSSVLMGPLRAVRTCQRWWPAASSAPSRARCWWRGMEHAPSLRNFFERKTLGAPSPRRPTTSSRCVKRRLGEAVLVVPPGFEAELARGDKPVLELVNRAPTRAPLSACSGCSAPCRLRARTGGCCALTFRGVAPALLEPVKVEERDLADPRARAAQLTGMVPFFVLMAVLYGALNAALDTTAGERERGSLEPLLMTPASRLGLVVGKWGAVAAVGMLIAVLSCLSFLPAQSLMRSETLAALFRFGMREATLFLALLLPLAAAAVGVDDGDGDPLQDVQGGAGQQHDRDPRCVAVAAAVAVQDGGEEPWHVWVPGLAQNELMGRALQGESLSVRHWLIPPAVCAALTVVCLRFVARHLREAAVRP